MHKIIFFPEKKVFLHVSYLKFSDLLLETHLSFYLALLHCWATRAFMFSSIILLQFVIDHVFTDLTSISPGRERRRNSSAIFLTSEQFCFWQGKGPYCKYTLQFTVKYLYFLTHQSKHIFWVLKRTVSLRRFFWVPTTYVLVEKSEKNIFCNKCSYVLFPY